MRFDVVVQFVVDFKDVVDPAKAEVKVRKMLDKLPRDVDVDAIEIQPSNQEKMLKYLERELGVKSERIAKALKEYAT